MHLRLQVWLLASGLASAVKSQNHYPITGVEVAPKATIPLRQSISDLQAQGGAQWDLYIRSLSQMFSQDPQDLLSFFQIAGIHGKPFIEWDDTGPERADGWAGYCPHGEKLFLPWHRPMLVLYEQVLVETAKQLANEYPQRYRAQYQQAASNLRAPFWDWASDSTVPAATVPSTVAVNIPSGNVLREVQVDNPLAGFKFPEAALNGTYGDFDSQHRTQTYRCPAPDVYPDTANQNLAKRTYKQWVYDAFTHASNFSAFASTGDNGISLEQIHNGIHWDAGCAGQFLDAQFSAFDPLFMLHHCNVDRLWSYWQAIHPDEAIFIDSYSGGSRWSTPQGTIITPDSPLEPFYGADNVQHTSNTVASLKGFGYSYAGLEYWEKSGDQMMSDAKDIINRLYGDGSNSARRATDPSSDFTRYFIRVELDVGQVERPCSVNVFVGGQSAGSLVIMQQPASGTYHGGFSLDEPVHHTGLRGLSVDSTMNSIQDALDVQIVKPNGERISLDSVPSLRIDLEDVRVTPAQNSNEFPQFSGSRLQPAKMLNLKVSTTIL